MKLATPLPRYLSIGVITLLFAACTTTITRIKQPEFAVPADSVAATLNNLVTSQHINLEGKEITTNGKDSTSLEIQIINARHIPEGEAQKLLGRTIATGLHNILQDKNAFRTIQVLFIKIDSSSAVTKRTWNGYTYPATEL